MENGDGKNISIAIVGGGISALVSAFYIKKYIPTAKITLFEKEKELGGKMKTQNVGEFLFEEGSNGFLSNKPDTLELVKEANAEDILIKSNDDSRIRYIFDDKMYRLPENPKEFIKTGLLCPFGKIRVAMEFFIPPKKNDEDESLESFGYRRIGREATQKLLDPMTAGVFASTPKDISVKAAFPAVVKLENEYGGLFRGMLAKKKKEAGPGGVLMSFKGGVSSFIERLENQIDMDILKNCPIQKIRKTGDRFLVEGENLKMSFDLVVASAPSYEVANMLGSEFEKLSTLLEKIEYSPIFVIGFGYEELKHDLKGFGLLTTSGAKKDVLGVLWDSSIFDDRAPLGKKSVRVMIGGQRDKRFLDKSEEELIEIAKSSLKDLMGIDENPIEIYVKKYEKGIPNYRVGHIENVEKIFQEEEKINGLYLSSNAYSGVGLNDCVANAKKVAQKIARKINTQ